MSYAFVVSNPNPDVAARQVRYQMAAYDAQGTVLAVDGGTIVSVGAGQQIGVAGELPLAADLLIDRIEVLLRPGEFVQGVAPTLLPVENPAFVPGQPPSITGIVRNDGNQDLDDVEVVAIAFEGDAVIGGGSVTVPFVAAQGQTAFSIPIATSLQPTRVEFFASLESVTTR